ncbi:MAG: phosphate regulon sensor histidine kinase PhoR [Gammaproteobacteria bacterium]|nr:MAG: phosphate regulon sensor histidine kinase PhoR [Gammaproteobacteria bacterium]
MHRGLQAEIRRIALITLLLLFIGFMLDQVLLTLLVGGGVYMLWTFSHIARLYDWLDQGANGLPPDASGVWGDMTDYLYRMQQRNERAKQSRRQLSERVRNITSALPDGIMTLTPDRVLEWWNPAAESLLGLEKHDRGQSIINIVRDPRFVAFIQHRELPPPVELSSPEDPSRTLMFSAAVFGDGNIILVVQDITRLRNLEQMRQDFVANISHELRTPLTVLSGYIETLQDNCDALPGSWKKALDQMDQQAERLNALANDLVMLSQLESNRKPPPRTPVDVTSLLHQIQHDGLMLCSENHRITTDCDNNLELRGEYKEIYSAVSNLVFNAIKHNPGGVDIRLNGHSSDDEVIIEVCDNGNGIDPKHIPRLTERFYRVDHSRASSTGGTGLGLAIVKHVLMRHGGTLEIQSTLGKGSCFRCHLPKSTVVA